MWRRDSIAKIFDLGCGTHKVTGAVGVDSPEQEEHNTDADIRHDLNEFPYDFAETGSVDVIYMNDSLEHLDNPLQTIVECYRLLKEGGELRISVPLDDPPEKNPFHRHEFYPAWFYTFDPDREYHWPRGADWNDKPRFSVTVEFEYHRTLKHLLLWPIYALRSPDNAKYDVYGKRKQLDVTMVKRGG